MILVPLTRGLFAKIDDCDYALVSNFTWQAQPSRKTYYAIATVKDGTVRMHRLIIDAPSGVLVDHRNFDGLDNQRHNLRIATPTESGQNRRAYSGKKFKGVYAHPYRGLWRAQITVLKKRVHLGLFPTQEQAANAYDRAARQYFGAFAQCNFEI